VIHTTISTAQHERGPSRSIPVIVENGARTPWNDPYPLSLKSRPWVMSHTVSSWRCERSMQGLDPGWRDRLTRHRRCSRLPRTLHVTGICALNTVLNCHGAYEGPPYRPWCRRVWRFLFLPNHGGQTTLIVGDRCQLLASEQPNSPPTHIQDSPIANVGRPGGTQNHAALAFNPQGASFIPPLEI